MKVLTPTTSSPLMNGWNRKWLLKLSDPNQKQVKIGLVCDNDTGKGKHWCMQMHEWRPRPNFSVLLCRPVIDDCTSEPLWFCLSLVLLTEKPSHDHKIHLALVTSCTPPCSVAQTACLLLLLVPVQPSWTASVFVLPSTRHRSAPTQSGEAVCSAPWLIG